MAPRVANRYAAQHRKLKRGPTVGAVARQFCVLSTWNPYHEFEFQPAGSGARKAGDDHPGRTNPEGSGPALEAQQFLAGEGKDAG